MAVSITIRVFLALLALAAPLGFAEVPAEHRDESADGLGGLFLTELSTKPKRCPEYMVRTGWFSVLYCGKSGDLKSAEPDAVMGRMDEILAPHAAPLEPWMTEGRRHERAYSLGELRIVVGLDSKRGIASFRYPLQDFGCIGDRLLAKPGIGVSNPVVVRKIDPRYPEEARERRENGWVHVEAVVEKDGTVSDACVIKSSHEHLGFREAAIEAVLQWRYKPAMKDGEPVPVRFYVSMDWTVH